MVRKQKGYRRTKRNLKNKALHGQDTRMMLALKKTNGLCAHCGKPLDESHCTIDHIIPKADGGTRDINNVMPLCQKCNNEKADKIVDIKEFYPYATKYSILAAINYANGGTVLPEDI